MARSASSAHSSLSERARLALIRRFYAAIDKKLQQMEGRMKREAGRGKAAITSADHERDARTIGNLISQLGKLAEYESDLARSAEREDATAHAVLAADADRYRFELVERLARLMPPEP